MVTKKIKGHSLGLHRVLDPVKTLPQNAMKLDASPQIFSNEILIDVEFLQIDSASFHQLCQTHASASSLKQAMTAIIFERGKMQNPVTGSGGMLLGKVAAVGSDYPDRSLKVGAKLATLVSLTATPLSLKEIHDIDFGRERVKISGEAILFEKSLYAVMPSDISEGAALAAFDICGAPLLTVKHAKAQDKIFVLGLGKAGRSVLAGLKYKFGDTVKLFGADANKDAVKYCQDLYGASSFSVLNAQDPVEVLNWAEKQTGQELMDLTVNLVNVPNSEMPTILATRDGGKCLFYSMATDFKKATLGCESVAKDVMLLMGIGYTEGHAEFMLKLLQHDKNLRAYFEEKFSHE